MGNRFASGKNAIAECDRCGQRYKLKMLKREVIKTKNYDLLVCPECRFKYDKTHGLVQLVQSKINEFEAAAAAVKIQRFVRSKSKRRGNRNGGKKLKSKRRARVLL